MFSWELIYKITAILGLLGFLTLVITYWKVLRNFYFNLIKFKSYQNIHIEVLSDNFVRDGIINFNVVWQSNYRLFFLNVKNTNSEYAVEDLRIDIYAPVGLLTANIYRQDGCQDLLIQCEDHLAEQGEITRGSNKQVVSTFKYFKNEMRISSLKLQPNSSFIIRFVLVYPNSTVNQDGFLNTKYTISNIYNKKKSITEHFKLDSSSNDFGILTLLKNESKTKWTMIMQPLEPLIFKEEGTISQETSD